MVELVKFIASARIKGINNTKKFGLDAHGLALFF